MLFVCFPHRFHFAECRSNVTSWSFYQLTLSINRLSSLSLPRSIAGIPAENHETHFFTPKSSTKAIFWFPVFWLLLCFFSSEYQWSYWVRIPRLPSFPSQCFPLICASLGAEYFHTWHWYLGWSLSCLSDLFLYVIDFYRPHSSSRSLWPFGISINSSVRSLTTYAAVLSYTSSRIYLNLFYFTSFIFSFRFVIFSS